MDEKLLKRIKDRSTEELVILAKDYEICYNTVVYEISQRRNNNMKIP